MEKSTVYDILELLTRDEIVDNQLLSLMNESEQAIMASNREDLKQLLSRYDEPLNIVVMGEVKAGKSTLINAMVGEKVSLVGVTETTAAIIEITNGSERKATVIRHDHSKENLTIDGLHTILAQHKDDRAYFKQIEKIILTYPLKRLKSLHIVDTPGLGTVTQANQDVTENYIQQSDVVLWVLSVHHLGDASVYEALERVALTGKPMIILINRVDQLNPGVTIDQVVDYVKEDCGLFTEKVFPLSALQAFEGIETGDSAKLKQSGLPAVMTYLNNHIEKSSTEVKASSVHDSLMRILEKETLLTIRFIERLKFLHDLSINREKDIHVYKEKISRYIYDEAERWFKFGILQQEEEDVSLAINNGKQKNAGEKVKHVLSERYIEREITTFLEALSEKVDRELKGYLTVMGEKIKEEERLAVAKTKHLISDYQLSLQLEDGFGKNELIEGAKTGALLTGTYGVASAFYVAVLGPAAAVVTIGTALSVILPPLLLTGAVTGIVYRFFSKNAEKRKLQEEVTRLFAEARMNIKGEVKPLIRELETDAEKFLDTIYQKMIDHFLNGASPEQLNEAIRLMEDYRADLKERVDKLKLVQQL